MDRDTDTSLPRGGDNKIGGSRESSALFISNAWIGKRKIDPNRIERSQDGSERIKVPFLDGRRHDESSNGNNNGDDESSSSLRKRDDYHHSSGDYSRPSRFVVLPIKIIPEPDGRTVERKEGNIERNPFGFIDVSSRRKWESRTVSHDRRRPQRFYLWKKTYFSYLRVMFERVQNIIKRFKIDSNKELDFAVFVDFAYRQSSGYITPYA